MHRPPRPRAESIFAGGLKSRILLRGLAIGGTTYWVFQQSLALGNTVEYAQTVAFATLVFAPLWHIFDSRTVTTLFDRNPFESRTILGAVALSALLSLGAIYSGAGNLVLGTAPLAVSDLVACIAIAALPTLVLSGLKALFRFRWL
jgi:Ca2+-transporting ATPase